MIWNIIGVIVLVPVLSFMLRFLWAGVRVILPEFLRVLRHPRDNFRD